MAREMRREVTGVVEQLLDRSTGKGKEYAVLRIGGEGYFDWSGLAAKNQVAEGDRVRLKVGEGRWPRVFDLEKLPPEKKEPGNAPAKAEPPVSARTQDREETITRLSCIRTAAVALSNADIPAEHIENRLVELAGKLEKWVTRRARWARRWSREGGVHLPKAARVGD
jgi:hypothetical protein